MKKLINSYLHRKKDRPGNGPKEGKIFHLHIYHSLIDDGDGMFLVAKTSRRENWVLIQDIMKNIVMKKSFILTKPFLFLLGSSSSFAGGVIKNCVQ